MLLKAKNLELMNCVLITEYFCHKISSQYSSSVIFNIFSQWSSGICFLDSKSLLFNPTSQKRLFLPFKIKNKIQRWCHSFYLVLALGEVLMINTLQWFHWHEQHMFKVDPNFSITHPSHLLSQILYKVKILN